MIVGNKQVWTSLFKSKPQLALLCGPSGVGKKFGSTLFAKQLTGNRAHIFSKFTTNESSQVLDIAYKGSEQKFIIIAAKEHTVAAWNDILFLLENPPPNCYIWIILENSLPQAIRTRCSLHYFDLLTPDAVLRVVSRLRSKEEASKLVGKSLSSVESALHFLDHQASVSRVQGLLTSINEGSYAQSLSSVALWNEFCKKEFDQILSSSLLSQSAKQIQADDVDLRIALTESMSGSNPSLASISAALSLLL